MPTRMTRRPRRLVRRSKFTLARSKPTVAFKKKVRRVIRQTAEKKYLAYSASAVGVDSAGTAMLSLLDVPQGDLDSTRDGDQLFLRSIQLNFSISLGDTTNFVRVILFQWFPTLTGLPPVASILLDTSRPWLSPYNHDQRFNFRIFHDKTYCLDTLNNEISRRMFLKSKFRRHIQYVGGATAVAANRIFALFISDSGAAPHPALQYSGKTNFTDA